MNGIVGPLAPIIGALIGAVIAAAVTYYLVVKRKSLGFWITETEDLTSALRRHHQQITVSVGSQPFFDLNRSTILVKNRGNTSVSDFKFDIEIPGNHNGYLIEVIEGDPELRTAISIKGEQPPRTYNPVLEVLVGSFLNPGESFKVAVFFDGAPDACQLRCRIPDVNLTVRSGEPTNLRDLFLNPDLVSILIPILVATAGAGAAVAKLPEISSRIAEWVQHFLK